MFTPYAQLDIQPIGWICTWLDYLLFLQYESWKWWVFDTYFFPTHTKSTIDLDFVNHPTTNLPTMGIHFRQITMVM